MASTFDNGDLTEQKGRWQTMIKSLKEAIHHIYESKEFWDTEYEVDTRKFKVHRLILGARSPRFAEILLKSNAPKHISCHKVSEVGFEILLRFIYTDEVRTSNKSEILDAYRADTEYTQEELLEKCTELMALWEISSDNVCTLLNEAHGIEFLEIRCLSYITNNSEDVLKSRDFLEATSLSLQKIFENKCFNDVSVSVLLPNVLQWSANQYSEPTDYEHVRKQLLSIKILGKLKIQELSVDELITFFEKYPNLLSSEEFVKFTLHANKPNEKPLPEWCSLE